jgi:hypothetical protein
LKDLSNKEMQVQEECVTDKKKTSNKDNDAVWALTMPILSQTFKLIHSTKSHSEWKVMKQYWNVLKHYNVVNNQKLMATSEVFIKTASL